ncbi:polymerase delta-interacting protein 3-like isoform X2 [Phlebotomus argentipes]|uniref:polymerase delta-interacting protein 3-like isoform X2 n=1 Tax=Phlebotomus argentipes TaxID=94469 RepID=UPI002892A2CF|nr:polymerase delta-interacting protein 3-like isoform X2 [Phlebotomus argentipes]
MEVDMSLDDIIKKKKIGGIGKKGAKNVKNDLGVKNKGVKKAKQSHQAKPAVFDARLKIIQRNRSKIRDARDKLSEIARKSDARLKIGRKINAPLPNGPRGGRPRPRNVTPRGYNDPGDTLYIGAPRGYVDHDRMESDEITFPVESPVLRRTVSNDFAFGGAGRPMNWSADSDPFDLYDLPRRDAPRVPYSSLQVYPGPSESLSPRKGILRRGGLDSPPRIVERRYIPDENSQLSYEMRTRLERAPDPRASAGMFARRDPTPSPPPATDGYRIVVSNLHPTVTQNDIVELFEDIGQLMEARLVRPGVAEVIFKGLKDAEQAVDTYHNRQLDGLPMKCLLVNPKSANTVQRPSGLSRTFF